MNIHFIALNVLKQTGPTRQIWLCKFKMLRTFWTWALKRLCPLFPLPWANFKKQITFCFYLILGSFFRLQEQGKLKGGSTSLDDSCKDISDVQERDVLHDNEDLSDGSNDGYSSEDNEVERIDGDNNFKEHTSKQCWCGQWKMLKRL